MRTILIATSNESKFKEIKSVFEDYGITNICSLKDIMPVDEPEEDGDTCQQNAFIKASYYADKFPEYIVLADDSGIFIEDLNWEPGVYAARWGGAHNTEEIRQKLVKELQQHNISKSNAYYECAMVLIDNEREVTITEIEAVKGLICDKPSGPATNKLAYYPYFYINENETLADIKYSDEERFNKISHRGMTTRKMLNAIINEYYK